MLDPVNDIQSLTTFRRRSGDFMKQLKKTKRPVVLTVKGRAAAVVQDAEAYQHLLDIAVGADPAEGIRQGLEPAKRGGTNRCERFLPISKPLMACAVDLGERAERDSFPGARPAWEASWRQGRKWAALSFLEDDLTLPWLQRWAVTAGSPCFVPDLRYG